MLSHTNCYWRSSVQPHIGVQILKRVRRWSLCRSRLLVSRRSVSGGHDRSILLVMPLSPFHCLTPSGSLGSFCIVPSLLAYRLRYKRPPLTHFFHLLFLLFIRCPNNESKRIRESALRAVNYALALITTHLLTEGHHVQPALKCVDLQLPPGEKGIQFSALHHLLADDGFPPLRGASYQLPQNFARRRLRGIQSKTF